MNTGRLPMPPPFPGEVYLAWPEIIRGGIFRRTDYPLTGRADGTRREKIDETAEKAGDKVDKATDR
jgi:hypothetical protein